MAQDCASRVAVSGQGLRSGAGTKGPGAVDMFWRLARRSSQGKGSLAPKGDTVLGPLLWIAALEPWTPRLQPAGGLVGGPAGNCLAWSAMVTEDPRPPQGDTVPGGEVRDATLAERARGGDPEAFAALFRRWEADVGRVCRRLLGPGAAAEDAISEAFLRARRALDSYAPDRPFRTWLLSIASHHCIDQLRRRSREQKIFDAGETGAADLADPSPSPLKRLVGREERERVLVAVEALPEKYRLPLVLRYFSEMDYEAISEVLDVPRAQLGTLLFRARRRLRDLLADGRGR